MDCADEEEAGDDIDRRFRRGWRWEDGEHVAVHEGSVQDPALEEERGDDALRTPWGLAHWELQSHRPHDTVLGQGSCHQGHHGLLCFVHWKQSF